MRVVLCWLRWQMCVVNDKQVSPIWINQNTLIRVRASLPVGMYVVQCCSRDFAIDPECFVLGFVGARAIDADI